MIAVLGLRLAPSRWSLTQRQLLVIGGCLTLLAILLGVGGAWFIDSVAETSSDRLLAASAQTITDTIGVENGALTLEVSPNALAMVAAGGRDSVFYSVTQGQATLTGYPDLPAPRVVLSDGQPRFRYDRYLGRDIRIVAQSRQLLRLPQPAIVQVAETLEERHALARSMMVGLVLLETTLVGFAVFLVWPAIIWGLKPLTTVRRELDSRGPANPDFAALSVAAVPPELGGLITGFNDLLERLHQSTSRIRRFTADASHQLRTPLAALRLHAELLGGNQIDDATIAASSHDIIQSVDRLQRLVTQLLALAEAETKALESNPVQAEPDAIVRELLFRLAPAAHRAGIELGLDVRKSFIVPLEPILLEELITNLVDNAIRYSEGSEVIVRIAGSESSGQIIVEDNGRGIPFEHFGRVRERFYRLPRDENKPGSGLGLSIVSTIAERAGAIVTMQHLESQQGFQITINFV